MSRIAYPFLTLSGSALEAGPWTVVKGNEDPEEAGEFLADWDYATSLRLHRSIRLDPAIAAIDLGVDPLDLKLAARVQVGTGPGRMPRSIIRHMVKDIPAEDPFVEFRLELPGHVLSTLLQLDTSIVLAQPSRSPGELSPRQVGARLWHDALRMRLEGEEPRFPIEIANFAKILGNSTAASSPWYLHWSSREWWRDFHGSIRLYLNDEHRDLINRVEAEEPETLRFLMADVMGQVCESLVREEDAESILATCEPGSLGSQAALWLGLAFPGQDISHARSVLSLRPGVFRACFQAVAEQKGADS